LKIRDETIAHLQLAGRMAALPAAALQGADLQGSSPDLPASSHAAGFSLRCAHQEKLSKPVFWTLGLARAGSKVRIESSPLSSSSNFSARAPSASGIP
jgi:hypothetical protein